MTTVALIRETSLVTDADVARLAAALQVQVDRDLVPAWGADLAAHVVAIPPGATVPAGAWELVLLDDSDQAGDLGYHILTAAGLPLARVFVATDQRDGLSWSVTASHELLEMLGDPKVDQTAALSDGRVIARELADPVEDDADGYTVEGMLLSNFVYPAYFTGSAGPFDNRALLTGPAPAMRSGGYLMVRDAASTVWSSVYGDQTPHSRVQPGRIRLRAQRRLMGEALVRSQPRNSTVRREHELEPQLARVFEQLETINRKVDALMSTTVTNAQALADLQAQVTQNTTVEASALALITGLAGQLTAAGTDPEALEAIKANLNTSATALAAAVAANTPAAPSAPPTS